MSSDTQMIAFGAYAMGTGLAAIYNPTLVITLFAPITQLLESVTGLPAVPLPTLTNGVAPLMGAVGALASAIGAYYFIAVASGDETFKRNTIIGRYWFASTCFAACLGPYGSGLLLAFGIGDVVAATLMGYTIGFTSASQKAKKA